MTPDFPGAVPELPVRALDVATAYYRDRLGFTLDWMEGTIGLAGISRGRCRIFLADVSFRKGYGNTGPALTWLNLDGKDAVDALHREWSSRGAILRSAPASQPWGLHEFTAEDPDGNLFRVFYDFATPAREAGAR
jgi:uncharacterized glyoxalase superfamily protein PhnB